MTNDGIHKYTYDAWNRLVQVSRLGPTNAPEAIAAYGYDALGRRYRNRTEYFYYDNRWRLLEVRNGSDAATRQMIWGTQYIDELVCMDVDTDNDGSCIDENLTGPKYGFERYRYFQDANWNVTAIWAEHAAKMVERYEYDPYGTCRIFAGWDSSAGAESRSVIGESRVPGGNPIRYAGYYFDDETGMYQVRHRMYSPGLSRWLQRDPLGISSNMTLLARPLSPIRPTLQYQDGMNLYQYIGNRPAMTTDPLGLWGIQCPEGTVAVWVHDRDYPGSGHLECVPLNPPPPLTRGKYCGQLSMACKSGTKSWPVYGDSTLAGTILPSGSGCVTLLFPTKHIICTSACDEIPFLTSAGDPTVDLLDHEACHACAYEDSGTCEYLRTWAGDRTGYCDKNSIVAVPNW